MKVPQNRHLMKRHRVIIIHSKMLSHAAVFSHRFVGESCVELQIRRLFSWVLICVSGPVFTRMPHPALEYVSPKGFQQAGNTAPPNPMSCKI